MYLTYAAVHIICNGLHTFVHAAQVDFMHKKPYNKINKYIEGGMDMKLKKLVAAVLSGLVMLSAQAVIPSSAANNRVSVHDPSIVADWSGIKDDNGYYPGVRVAVGFAEETGILTGVNRPSDISMGELALILANSDRVFDKAKGKEE